MKNVFGLALLLILFFSACNDDDNNSPFNPPDWIQGTWLKDGYSHGWKFTNDDVSFVDGNTIESYAAYFVEEEIYSNNYLITIHQDISPSTHHFRKISETEFELVSSQSDLYVKQ